MSREEQPPAEVLRARELRRLAGLPASVVAIEVIVPAVSVLQRILEVRAVQGNDRAAPPAA